MEVDFASRVGLHVVTKVATPILLWIGRRTLFPLLGPMTPEKAIGLGFLGFGATVIVSVKPEESLDFVLRGLSNTARAAGAVMNVAADQLRRLEKVDLENLVNAPFRYFGGSASAGESASAQGALLIAPPLPKDYTLANFPYHILPTTILRKTGNEEVDTLIDAYNALGIDVVSMILDNHQLPQLDLVRDIYLQGIKRAHPDKNRDADVASTTRRAGIINDSYAKIKTMMTSAEEQFEFINQFCCIFVRESSLLILFLAGWFGKKVNIISDMLLPVECRIHSCVP